MTAVSTSTPVQTAVFPLLQLLTESLQTNSPLMHLVAELGHSLSVDGCLLVGHHRETGSVTLSLWEASTGPYLWSYSGNPPTQQTSTERMAGLRLLRKLLDTQGCQPDFLKILQPLWQPSVEASLTCESCQVIPVDVHPQNEAALLFWGPVGQPWQTTVATLQVELAETVAIALYQQLLQQQAAHHIEQLRYLNHLKDDFLSTLNHELRTPLTSMMLAIRMLRRPDLTPERQAMYLDILEQQCSQETALVNDLLSLRTLESSSLPMSPASINLNQFLQTIIENYRERFETADLKLELSLPQQGISLETEPTDLSRILQELLINAYKYAEPGSIVTLGVEQDHHQPDRLLIKLVSEGMGIPPDEIPHIFEKFRRGQGATQRAIPGTGTGLALVKELVKRLQGNISVQSQPWLDGRLWRTCFTLTLPMGIGCH